MVEGTTTAEGGPGRRQRRKQRITDDLERLALELFAERGYDAVTVGEIAEAASVSARTFFRHFRSKDDVVTCFYRQQLQNLRARLAARPRDESALLTVREAMVGMARDHVDGGADTLRVRARLLAETPSLAGRSLEIQQQWEAAIALEIAERLGIDAVVDLRPALVGACAVAALRVATNAWLEGQGEVPLPDLVDAAMLLLARDADAQRGPSAEGLRTARPSG